MQEMSEVPEAPLEPETPPAAPPGPPEQMPEPIEEEADESDGADWDALDLDEITLPGQKSAKELAAEKVSGTAPGCACARQSCLRTNNNVDGLITWQSSSTLELHVPSPPRERFSGGDPALSV